jgi:ArsR family transcriptional regulator
MRNLNHRITKTADILKVLGHPMRLEILSLLSGSKPRELPVKEIGEQLGLSQPETSKHLVLMKNMSVLLCERREGHSYYKLNNEHSYIQSIINHIKNK